MSDLPLQESASWPASHAGRASNTAISRRAMFWLLQLGGWTVYGLSKLLAFPMTALDSAWVIGKGVLLTCGLRWFYQRLERYALPLPVTIAVAMVAAMAVGKLSLEISHWASLQGVVFVAPGAAAWLRTWEAALHEFMVLMAWSALYLGIRYAMDLHREKEHLREALADAQRARTQMLRYQLNPHFLFNALTSLRASIGEDPSRAQAMIDDLSGFLRYSLLCDSADEATLEREFKVIRHYLAIQEVRFEERIEYVVDLDPGLAHVRLPAFLIQPLVENAVKYGMRTSDGVTTISVTGKCTPAGCVLVVENSGRWVDEAGALADLDRSGIGLANLRQRLLEHFHGRHQFTVEAADGWVRARLLLEGAC